jgi:hypothetical protein
MKNLDNLNRIRVNLDSLGYSDQSDLEALSNDVSNLTVAVIMLLDEVKEIRKELEDCEPGIVSSTPSSPVSW